MKGSMVDLPFADTDVAAKAGRYVIYVLAVFGGFLVGNVLTLILCRLLAKAMFRRRMPEQLERALRVIGGIVVAALVAFLLFRMGPGWGLGGSGTGEGEGSGGPSNQSQQKQSETGPDSRAKEKPAFLATGLEITILRGRDYPKSYLFEAERAGVELATAKEKLRKRLAESEGRLKFVDILIYKNSTADQSALVKDLVDFADELGLRTSRKKLDRLLPE
ncbi:MAG TPA: hypothetical protein VKD71_12040 [Gemmataceae bacterium]|nr:hypothetical protein [Gemmataceae bacterium]